MEIIPNLKNVIMTRILVSGFSFLILLVSCISQKNMSKKINRNVLPDNEGKIYYRDLQNKIEIKYFGDYTFKTFTKKELKNISEQLSLHFSHKDTALFLASTVIPPFYKSTVIKLSAKPHQIIKNLKTGLNRNGSQFIYLDTINILRNKFVFLFWGNYDTSFPDSASLNLTEKNGIALIEINEIRKSISIPQKNFFNDISSLAYNSLSNGEQNSLNYLAPILRLSSYQNKNLNQAEQNYLFQLLSTYQSFFGNADSAIYYYSKAFNKKFIQLNLPDSDFTPAKEIVLTAAKESQILLINEAHTDIRNRYFIRHILPDLYESGYRVLAVEALSQKDTLINTRKYPVIETGFYTKEPVFASLLTKALSIGFTLSAYDCFPDCKDCVQSDSYCCINRREECQATNISKIINDNRKSKIIIFGGHDHIYKGTPLEGFKTMAMYLSEKGYRFTSIDQVKGNYYFLSKTETNYLSVVDTTKLPKSFTNYKADVYIVPPYPFTKNKSANYKKTYTINLNSIIPPEKRKARLYIKVFHSTDSMLPKAIPIFISEIKQNEKKLNLPLDKGEYLIQISSASKTISERRINVTN